MNTAVHPTDHHWLAGCTTFIHFKGFEVKNFRGTDSYLYLEQIVLSSKKPPMAKIELEIGYNKSINRETRILGVGDDLYFV